MQQERVTRIDRLARRAVQSRLSLMSDGALTFVENGEPRVFGNPDAGPQATLELHGPGLYRALFARGPLGAAESYMDGEWTCDDLTAAIQVVVRNRHVVAGLEGGTARAVRPLLRGFHRLRDNSRRGSRRNIASHYDLGNEFFALFLDPTLTYSCAVFERDGMSLEEAQIAKYDRICRKLDLGPGDHVLEIGTGWGGFAMHAAGRHGCRVTTTTISREQYELARKRIEQAGLSDRIQVLFEDYRDVAGQYDKLVSIEMIEAVGAKHLPGFFRVCGERLRPNGQLAIQAITTPDQMYARSVKNVEFIKRYIFPGGQITSIGAMNECVARETDMRLTHVEDLTPHYAETLSRWRRSLHANLDRIRDLGLPDRFLRMWEYYFCYCEGAFAERANGVAQLVWARPEARSAPVLGSLA